jgi:hypothetical protein
MRRTGDGDAPVITLDSTITRNPNVSVHSADAGAVFVDLGSGNCWEANAVAATIWDALTATPVPRLVVDAIERKYGVSRQVLENDVLALLRELARSGLIEVAAG